MYAKSRFIPKINWVSLGSALSLRGTLSFQQAESTIQPLQAKLYLFVATEIDYKNLYSISYKHKF